MASLHASVRRRRMYELVSQFPLVRDCQRGHVQLAVEAGLQRNFDARVRKCLPTDQLYVRLRPAGETEALLYVLCEHMVSDRVYHEHDIILRTTEVQVAPGYGIRFLRAVGGCALSIPAKCAE